MSVYTSDDWYIKTGYEEAFEDAWRAFVEASRDEIEPTAWATLSRDREDPSHFRSIAYWNNGAAYVEWRDGEGLARLIGQLSEMLEFMETSVFEVTAASGDSPLR
jgi:quinol monooxygenase YgiN